MINTPFTSLKRAFSSLSTLALPLEKSIPIHVIRFITLQAKSQGVAPGKINIQLQENEGKIEAYLFLDRKGSLLSNKQLSFLFMGNEWSASLVKGKIKQSIARLKQEFEQATPLQLHISIVNAQVLISVFQGPTLIKSLDVKSLLALL
ncbi:MAG: hypothetical protein AAFN81_02940 [Bacteroidota bacterium]